MTISRRLPAATLLLALLLSACAGAPPPTRFLLRSLSTAPLAEPGPSRRVVVAPVRLPDYLDHNEIVVRDGAAVIRYDEAHQWAEQPSLTLTRVLASDLQSLRPADLMLPESLPQRNPGDVTVVVDVAEMILADAGGRAVLRGRWTLLDGDGDLLGSRLFEVGEAPTGPGLPDRVEAMDRALRALAGQIAEALVRPSAGSPRP